VDQSHIDAAGGAVYSGRKLAYSLRGLSVNQRAVVAAGLGSRLLLVELTDKQLAAVFRISLTALQAAQGLNGQERADVHAGRRRLVEPSEQLERAIRRVGVEPAWNALCRALG
jgi:hypothetical protein